MDIMELGAIGELVGGVAEIGSLLYVGLQVRQNTAATRAASHHAITDSFNEGNLALARDPALADLWVKWRRDRSALPEAGRLQGDMLAYSFLRVFETLFYQSRVGTGEQQLLRAEERTLGFMFQMNGFREWWRENPFSFHSDFRNYVDSFFPDADNAPRDV